jgi:hypothetical protein
MVRLAPASLIGISLALIGIVLLFFAFQSSARQARATIDRRKPEAVLRGYFDAWGRNDWPSQASFMDEKYARMVPEPVDSLQIADLQILSSSAAQITYRVVFDIHVKGLGVSMHTGRYDWTYTLSWDSGRSVWLITNYGAG